MGIMKEFRDFAVKGNVVDMAVGIIIGAAFGTIVSSLVKDIVTPPIGMAMQGINFNEMFYVLKEGAKAAGPYKTLADAQAAGAVTITYGVFINACISFLITAFALFMLVRTMNRVRKLAEKEQASAPPAPNEKECPHCFTKIPIKATRCPHCTSQLTN